eukprot:SM000252S09056  [mRNA]  locus=s252:32446:35186:+ [translate_table: standard]
MAGFGTLGLPPISLPLFGNAAAALPRAPQQPAAAPKSAFQHPAAGKDHKEGMALSPQRPGTASPPPAPPPSMSPAGTPNGLPLSMQLDVPYAPRGGGALDGLRLPFSLHQPLPSSSSGSSTGLPALAVGMSGQGALPAAAAITPGYSRPAGAAGGGSGPSEAAAALAAMPLPHSLGLHLSQSPLTALPPPPPPSSFHRSLATPPPPPLRLIPSAASLASGSARLDPSTLSPPPPYAAAATIGGGVERPTFGQLSVFYNGTVNAQLLMLLAGSGDSTWAAAAQALAPLLALGPGSQLQPLNAASVVSVAAHKPLPVAIPIMPGHMLSTALSASQQGQQGGSSSAFTAVPPVMPTTVATLAQPPMASTQLGGPPSAAAGSLATMLLPSQLGTSMNTAAAMAMPPPAGLAAARLSSGLASTAGEAGRGSLAVQLPAFGSLAALLQAGGQAQKGQERERERVREQQEREREWERERAKEREVERERERGREREVERDKEAAACEGEPRPGAAARVAASTPPPQPGGPLSAVPLPQQPGVPPIQAPKEPSDARKASLQRFREKRKDRGRAAKLPATKRGGASGGGQAAEQQVWQDEASVSGGTGSYTGEKLQQQPLASPASVSRGGRSTRSTSTSSSQGVQQQEEHQSSAATFPLAREDVEAEPVAAAGAAEA